MLEANFIEQRNHRIERAEIEGRRSVAPSEVIGPLRAECDELCRIISASKKTAEERLHKEAVKRDKF